MEGTKPQRRGDGPASLPGPLSPSSHPRFEGEIATRAQRGSVAAFNPPWGCRPTRPLLARRWARVRPTTRFTLDIPWSGALRHMPSQAGSLLAKRGSPGLSEGHRCSGLTRVRQVPRVLYTATSVGYRVRRARVRSQSPNKPIAADIMRLSRPSSHQGRIGAPQIHRGGRARTLGMLRGGAGPKGQPPRIASLSLKGIARRRVPDACLGTLSVDRVMERQSRFEPDALPAVRANAGRMGTHRRPARCGLRLARCVSLMSETQGLSA